jgi:hypothetical protein
MRMYPPVWLMVRRPVHDLTLGNFKLPGGCYTHVSPHLTDGDHGGWRTHAEVDRVGSEVRTSSNPKSDTELAVVKAPTMLPQSWEQLRVGVRLPRGKNEGRKAIHLSDAAREV